MGELLTAGGLTIAGIVWAVRLEGRVNAHEQLLREQREDLKYIRARIDKALDQ